MDVEGRLCQQQQIVFKVSFGNYVLSMGLTRVGCWYPPEHTNTRVKTYRQTDLLVNWETGDFLEIDEDPEQADDVLVFKAQGYGDIIVRLEQLKDQGEQNE